MKLLAISDTYIPYEFMHRGLRSLRDLGVDVEVRRWEHETLVELQVDASDTPLRAGMLAQAGFDHSESEGLIVPMSAIVDPVGGDPRVFRVEDGTVHTTHVDIVASSEARVAVIPRDGGVLATGDLVVTEGHRALTDGQPVRTAL